MQDASPARLQGPARNRRYLKFSAVDWFVPLARPLLQGIDKAETAVSCLILSLVWPPLSSSKPSIHPDSLHFQMSTARRTSESK